MNLNKALFWDTDINKIDFNKNARSIIERVVSRGTLKDWFEIKNYYGLEKIKKEVTQIRFLDKITLNFLSKYFQIPKTKFRCYNTKPYIKKLWNY